MRPLSAHCLSVVGCTWSRLDASCRVSQSALEADVGAMADSLYMLSLERAETEIYLDLKH